MHVRDGVFPASDRFVLTELKNYRVPLALFLVGVEDLLWVTGIIHFSGIMDSNPVEWLTAFAIFRTIFIRVIIGLLLNDLNFIKVIMRTIFMMGVMIIIIMEVMILFFRWILFLSVLMIHFVMNVSESSLFTLTFCSSLYLMPHLRFISL